MGLTVWAGAPFTVITGKERLTLIAGSRQERDSWVASVEGAIASQQADQRDCAWASNSEWIERLFAEWDGEMTRDGPRLTEMARDYPRLPEITRE